MRWCSTLHSGDQIKEIMRASIAELAVALTGASPRLVFAFFSCPLSEEEGHALGILREAFPAAEVVGCTGRGVVGAALQKENESSISLTAAVMSDVELVQCHISPEQLPKDSAGWLEQLGIDPDLEPGLIVLSVRGEHGLQSSLSELAKAYPRAPVAGGLVSRRHGESDCRLIQNEKLHEEGVLVLALYGDLEMVSVIAQSGRPVGTPLLVTRAEDNQIYELDGRPALRMMQAVYENMQPEDRELFQRGPLVGRVLDSPGSAQEYLFGEVIGVHRPSGMFTAGWEVSALQTIQFFVRDPVHASQSLADQLQKVKRAPGEIIGGVLFVCVARGEHFFGVPSHDGRLFQAMFETDSLGGVFCEGEIGGASGRAHMLAHTSSFALFKRREWS